MVKDDASGMVAGVGNITFKSTHGIHGTGTLHAEP